MIKLIQTSSGCPEQYDAYLDDAKIGYLRLRHGRFRAEYNDKTVYTASTKGDGVFDYDERDYYLNKACEAILAHHHHTTKSGRVYYIAESIPVGE